MREIPLNRTAAPTSVPIVHPALLGHSARIRMPRSALAIALALKRYGLLLADNGSDWYITGETNASWDDNNLNELKNISASAFEVVRTGPVVTGYC